MVVQEGVKVAGSVVDVLRTQPSTVAMIIISFALLAFTWYEGAAFNRQRSEMTQLILEHQRETSLMLSRCIEPSQVETIIKQLELNRQSYNEQIMRNVQSIDSNRAQLQQLIDLVQKQQPKQQ